MGGDFETWKGLREGKGRTTTALVLMLYIWMRAGVVGRAILYLKFAAIEGVLIGSFKELWS